MVENFINWQKDINVRRQGRSSIRVDQCALCNHNDICNKVRNARQLCNEFDSKNSVNFAALSSKDKKIVGSLYGSFIGDALGVPYEFRARSVMDKNPCTTMIAFGAHGQPLGTWSDDSSLMLATVDNIVEGFSLNGLARNFLNWMELGHFSPFGEVFDVGNTTYEAIMNYKYGQFPIHCGPTHNKASGNGSLMRILPMAFYTKNKQDYLANNDIINVSCITHGNKNCLLACVMYCKIVQYLFDGEDKIRALDMTREYIRKTENDIPDIFDRLMNADFWTIDRKDIRSSGFVVHTLESAIWSFLNTDNYKDCVIAAVNLGDDTDTTACVAGGLAGLYYGVDDIPSSWLNILARTHELNRVFTEFAKEMN